MIIYLAALTLFAGGCGFRAAIGDPIYGGAKRLKPEHKRVQHQPCAAMLSQDIAGERRLLCETKPQALMKAGARAGWWGRVPSARITAARGGGCDRGEWWRTYGAVGSTPWSGEGSGVHISIAC